MIPSLDEADDFMLNPQAASENPKKGLAVPKRVDSQVAVVLPGANIFRRMLMRMLLACGIDAKAHVFRLLTWPMVTGKTVFVALLVGMSPLAPAPIAYAICALLAICFFHVWVSVRCISCTI